MNWIYLTIFGLGMILAGINIIKITTENTVAGMNERIWYACGYFFISLISLAFWYAG